jgi:hypothetical protein
MFERTRASMEYLQRLRGAESKLGGRGPCSPMASSCERGAPDGRRREVMADASLGAGSAAVPRGRREELNVVDGQIDRVRGRPRKPRKVPE